MVSRRLASTNRPAGPSWPGMDRLAGLTDVLRGRHDADRCAVFWRDVVDVIGRGGEAACPGMFWGTTVGLPGHCLPMWRPLVRELFEYEVLPRAPRVKKRAAREINKGAYVYCG